MSPISEPDGTVAGAETKDTRKLIFTLNEGAPKTIRFHSPKGAFIVQEKRWQKLDRLAFIVPVVIFACSSISKEGRLIWGIAFKEQNLWVAAAVIFLLGLSTAISALPILLIWRAVSHTVKKAAMQNATFRTDEDFDYYREKLSGIPPTTISLLMDLQIETKKDVSALLLKYVKIGAVSIEDGSIHVRDQKLPELSAIERS